MPRANSLEKTLMLGKIEGKRRGQQRMIWLDSIIDSVAMNLSKLWKIVQERSLGVLQSIRSQRVGLDLVTYSVHFSSVAQSCPTLCDPMDCQASLSITNSWSLLKFLSIKLMMPSKHLILCRPLDRKSTRLNSSHRCTSRMPSSA